jgi:two-component system, chemotaxis family, chemotaxis protein CheY
VSSSSDENGLILAIDDDEDVRNLIAAALTPRGYRVIGAENGAVGLERIAETPARLVILDYWMPVLDGAGFMSGLREMYTQRPPVILFTALHDDPRLARDLGVDVYVEKPVELRRFVKLVDAMVRGAPTSFVPIPRTKESERRRHARLSIRRQVEVRTGDAPEFAPAFTVDLSEGGVCLDVALRHVVPGAYLAIAFTLQGGRRMEVDARIRYISPAGRVGAQFFGLDTGRKEALRELITAR